MAERDYKKAYQKAKERGVGRTSKVRGFRIPNDLFERFTEKANDEQVSKNSLITQMD